HVSPVMHGFPVEHAPLALVVVPPVHAPPWHVSPLLHVDVLHARPFAMFRHWHAFPRPSPSVSNWLTFFVTTQLSRQSFTVSPSVSFASSRNTSASVLPAISGV